MELQLLKILFVIFSLAASTAITLRGRSRSNLLVISPRDEKK